MLVTGTGLLLQFRRTVQYLAMTALVAGCYGLWRGRMRMQEYGHRKNYVKPLHVRLPPLRASRWRCVPSRGWTSPATCRMRW